MGISFDSGGIFGFYWDRNATYTETAVNDLVGILRNQHKLALKNGEKLIIVSHSWGTVISYIALLQLSQEIQCDLFITLGSPMGSGNTGMLFPPIESEIVNFTSNVLEDFGILGKPELTNVSRWVNYWSSGDLISGPLPIYHVENMPNLSPEITERTSLRTNHWHRVQGLYQTEKNGAPLADGESLRNSVRDQLTN